jgi:hypothetical protein
MIIVERFAFLAEGVEHVVLFAVGSRIFVIEDDGVHLVSELFILLQLVQEEPLEDVGSDGADLVHLLADLLAVIGDRLGETQVQFRIPQL